MEAVDEAVGLALQRPPQGDAAPAAQLLGVPDERLHRLRETHELGRVQTLQRAVLLDRETPRGHRLKVQSVKLNQNLKLETKLGADTV